MTAVLEMKGGVPTELFYRFPSDGIIQGNSGNTSLTYTLYSDQVYFQDVDHRAMHFNAVIEGDYTLRLSFQRRGYQGDPLNYHPDIQPRVLLREAIDYFARIGSRVDRIRARWNDHAHLGEDEFTDNYDTYMSYFKFLNHEPTDQDRVQAALSTWTGQRALELGFTNVKSIRDVHYGIEVMFEKPSQSPKVKA